MPKALPESLPQLDPAAITRRGTLVDLADSRARLAQLLRDMAQAIERDTDAVAWLDTQQVRDYAEVNQGSAAPPAQYATAVTAVRIYVGVQVPSFAVKP